jgi:hypothetical protein
MVLPCAMAGVGWNRTGRRRRRGDSRSPASTPRTREWIIGALSPVHRQRVSRRPAPAVQGAEELVIAAAEGNRRLFGRVRLELPLQAAEPVGAGPRRAQAARSADPACRAGAAVPQLRRTDPEQSRMPQHRRRRPTWHAKATSRSAPVLANASTASQTGVNGAALQPVIAGAEGASRTGTAHARAAR